MRIRGVVFAGVWLLGAPLAAVHSPGKIAIVYPANDSYVAGPLTIRVSITPPTLKVVRVSFFADSKLCCVVDSPPFECEWDAGPTVEQHQLRVVAQLADGSRLDPHTILTKGEKYTETVQVKIIQLLATVTDEHGGFVRGLRREDFRVYEDDVLQPIKGFTPENISLDLIVAVDMSGSMIDAMPQLRRSVKRFLTALRPQDQVTLMAFNDRPVTLARPTVNLATRLGAVDRLAGWGGTALYDTIVQSMETLSKKTGGKALLVFSDGDDTASHIPLATAERRVEQSDSVIYTIGQGRATRSPSLKKILDSLAKVSGGRAFFTENADKLDENFSDIIEELANQYLIGYEPPNSPTNDRWRRITVKTKDERLKVRVRQGYRR